MRHGIFSEAITRFTKGQPAELVAPVLADALQLLGEWASAKRVSNIAEAKGLNADVKSIELSARQVNRVLGTDLKLDEIDEILQSVEFATVATTQTTLAVAPPYWRADVHVIQDVIEELGRLRGFDSITPTLPARDSTATAPSSFDEFRAHIRRTLARAGANEVLTYSFIHGDIIKKVGQNATDSYKIVNSISPDLQYYRQSLTGGLLGLVYPNIKQGFDNFAVFELNKVHSKIAGLTHEDVPVELDAIALTVTDKKPQTTSPYYQAKLMLDYLADSLGLSLKYKPIVQEVANPWSAPFEYRRSARVSDDEGNELGIVGEYKKSVARGFKLPQYTAGFEIDAQKLFDATARLKPNYVPLSRYPGTERDICFQVTDDKTYAQIINEVEKVLDLSKLETSVSPVDIYQPLDGKTKNITIRVSLVAMDHTLASDEANDLIKDISGSVVKATGATVI
jgi:phenylalanyl-tRNA synthetase beta chain